ncbi:MAG: excinuclease ABC subunit UvrA, partial [Clostridiales Family XIII bacterium]|nr:excinuclease ABC subunit UvrA [Clostridiales Family XIII bacterium]
MATRDLYVKGANEHNLKNIDVRIPRDKFVVITGLSGSGKSSLAFDTIYAEGQRRYVESLSAYARQFLGQMDKPDVEYIEGLSPAISIDQKTTSRNPRSTVGTVTEIHDYLRLMYARVGVPHCPVCGREIEGRTVDQIVDYLMSLGEGTRVTLLAPVVRQRKGT